MLFLLYIYSKIVEHTINDFYSINLWLRVLPNVYMVETLNSLYLRCVLYVRSTTSSTQTNSTSIYYCDRNELV